MMLDTRAQGRRILGRFRFSVPVALAKSLIVAALAIAAAVVPRRFGWEPFASLSPEAARMLAIAIVAAGLWLTEAIPAFAVGILVIALQMVVLPTDSAVPDAWKVYLAPWSSPLIWLFLGGFVLAAAARKCALDAVLAHRVIRVFGRSPRRLLAGVMAVTFVLSMFMSNTATAAMMLAVLGPLTAGRGGSDPFARALMLGVAMAASLGGMGTIIGTPPNAIAVAAVAGSEAISFAGWMAIGLPPAVVLTSIAWAHLVRRFPAPAGDASVPLLSDEELVALHSGDSGASPRRSRGVTLAVFAASIALWMSEALHGLHPAQVSFFAIAVLAVGGVLTSADLRSLPWDVLLLLTGGLALGEGCRLTGLDQWIAGLIPSGWPPAGLTLALCLTAVTLSNFMSNTATASILMPVAVGLVSSAGGPLVAMAAPLALSCSCAMLLPVSTPPNAVAFSSGKLTSRDFLPGGLLLGLLGPLVVYGWCALVL